MKVLMPSSGARDGRLELSFDGCARSFGRRPGRGADHEEDALVPRKLDLGVDLRAVERPLRDELAALASQGEDVRSEPEPELRRERGRKAHGVDREPDEDDARAAVGDQLLDRLTVDVVLEFLLLHLRRDDLVDALDVDLICDRGGIPGDDGDDRLLLELLGGGDELERDRANLSTQVLGDDENAHPARSATEL